MQDKELEKILQEKADKTEMRDFSLVWDEIKDEITPKEKEKTSIWKKKFFLIFAPSLLVICIAISSIFFFKPTPPSDKIYFNDQLIKNSATLNDAMSGLSNANIPHVDLSRFGFTDTCLYYTDKMEVKGGYFEFYNENPTTFFAKMQLYDKSVQLNLDIENLYDTTCKVNSADVYYKFKTNSSGFYEYSIYAIHNKVQYLIEYSGVTDNLVEFLTDFFG